ncbi:MAG TPA: bifunctional (p)ppGpp synthetase/guanosine-3',5'-bis(diphosphate) 3'-pyrophosphohydrolase [Methylocella sp.]|jgi:GTP diphosphokinase / guanosine-3',5'-bis(diphosphate) 3'-diphosphatase|nr:bifunctional (p)ppGpp synthetase/guanosine-3',5'-bis(diphosphate) 3'-pyrophosphohydrolase [Methylocella sp.]
MMRQYELVDRVRRYNPQADEDSLNRAYVYAMKAHGVQTRASGDPYFSHPLEVAAILTDMKVDDATIVAAVLHDTIEDTNSTREEIDKLFGSDIGLLVDGLTKLKKLDLVSKRAEQAENFRKLLLAVAEDVRVLLIKLADRLHNMRTLQFVPEDKRARIAAETLDIYAPLAGRMGMQRMRDELEDSAFRHLMPEAYAMIAERLEDLRRKNGKIIAKIEKELGSELAARGIVATVEGRQKRPYSVWRKMERKAISFEQLSDIFGFRVVVDNIEDCYRVIGVVHTKWAVVPGRFKDYISTPKPNDYRSVHTTVVGPGRQRVELQVRTALMHDIARNGIAAHALYKDGQIADKESLTNESRSYQWLRRTVSLLAEGATPEEFLEHTKLELFHDQVFCFTPNGRLIALPRGATPVDFAYAVHTDVGNSAVGAKINGRQAPLLSELKNGDEVEIACAEGQTPPAVWEGLVMTGKARAAIRRATREAVRAQYAALGRQIVTRAFERAGKPFAEDKLKSALPKLARATTEDALAAVGRGEMFSGDVVRAAYPEFSEDRKAIVPRPRGETGWLSMKKATSLVFKLPGTETDKKSTPGQGPQSDLPVRFAPNGGAVPGDRIVGILTPGEGITIYPIQSPDLVAFDEQPERWLDVRWNLEECRHELFPARLLLTAINEPGTLAQIASVFGDHGANIDNIVIRPISADFRELTIDIEVTDLKHLTTIISHLRARPVVSQVERVNG